MNTLIIGGTGTISTAITDQLLARGDTVIHYNRGQRASPFGARVSTIQGDRREYAAFEQRMAAAGAFDCVMDMVGFEPEDAESAIRAFRGRCGHYVFCSTVDVYSKPAEYYPYTEEHPRDARGAYGQKKAQIEDILFAADARGELAVTSIRPAATYCDAGGSVVHTFGWNTTYFDRLRQGKPIVQFGDGNSLWTACHADDVARTFVNAAGNPRAFGRAYHATGEEWLTWNRYHETVCRAMGWPEPRIVHIPTDLLYRVVPEQTGWTYDNFQFNNIYDNTRAREELGFRYTIPFADGVKRLIEKMDSEGRIANSDDDPFDDRLIDAWERLGDGMAEAMQKEGEA